MCTPPLRRLTRKTSLGFDVVDFASQVLLLELLPWQRWLLIHALELLPDGSLRFRNVVVLVARQNGKSTLSQVLALWWMYVCGVRLVLGTAQDLDTAEEVWQGAVDLATGLDENDDPVRPELAALVKGVVRVNGKKSLDLLTGERYKVKAANRRSGRGLTGDRILLDELREHQSWDAWGAITKTTMARPDAQVWCLSNAGDVTSVVLRYLRKLGHAAVGDPDGINAAEAALLPSPEELEDIARWDAELDDLETDDFAVNQDDLGLFEWSAPPGCDVRDPGAWAQANPSMGYTISARTIASAARTDPEWVFRTEVLCQWSEGGLTGPFPPGAWEQRAAAVDEHGKLQPGERILLDRRVTSCLDVNWDRTTAYVGVAGRRVDGAPQVEVVARRPGTDWVVDWYCDPDHPERAAWPIVIQVGSPAWTLAEDLRDAGLRVVEWKGRDVGVGCGQLFDAVKQGPFFHTSQPVLNGPAATAATKVLEAGAWVFDRQRSPQDASPLITAAGALWFLLQRETPPPPAPPPPQVAQGSPEVHEIAVAGF